MHHSVQHLIRYNRNRFLLQIFFILCNLEYVKHCRFLFPKTIPLPMRTRVIYRILSEHGHKFSGSLAKLRANSKESAYIISIFRLFSPFRHFFPSYSTQVLPIDPLVLVLIVSSKHTDHHIELHRLVMPFTQTTWHTYSCTIWYS